MSFRGTHTALITPFRSDKVDRPALKELIDRQIDAGIDGIVPVGTTGESPTLASDEHLEVISLAVEYANGRCAVLAGTGANATAEAIELTVEAEKAGANATLQVCPYYNKPSAEGLYQHFKAVADATSLPVMLYSVPGRSMIDIPVETAVRLAHDCPTVVAIKEAGGSVDRVNQLFSLLPESFEILCGDDPLTLPFIACGAVGLVSVAGNLIPDVMCRLVKACLDNKFDQALELQKKYYPLFRGLMTLETNPVPIKEAVALQGFCTNEFRLPLVPLERDQRKLLRDMLSHHGLI